MSAIVREYLGEPWIMETHDCWQFFCRVQREKFGRDVPAIYVDADDLRACVKAFTKHDERGRWVEVDLPREGDAVLMSQSKQPTHVGIWIDGAVLHCVRGAGVVFSSLSSLKRIPYNVLGYYRPA